MPGYWFTYNMYALSRNTWKYGDRDRRTEKIQQIEYDFLAPDTINEMFASLKILSETTQAADGHFYIKGFEKSRRKTEIIRVPETIELFKELIVFYGVAQIFEHICRNKIYSFSELKKALPAKIERSKWLNVGGQLMPVESVKELQRQVKSGEINRWKDVHELYKKEGLEYGHNKLIHAYTSLLEIESITSRQFDPECFKKLLKKSVATKKWMADGIYTSRAKDYSSPFRKMVYESTKEMNIVMGRLEDNQFIQDQLKELDEYEKKVGSVIKKMKL